MEWETIVIITCLTLGASRHPLCHRHRGNGTGGGGGGGMCQGRHASGGLAGGRLGMRFTSCLFAKSCQFCLTFVYFVSAQTRILVCRP